jgi:hypothetical protein
VSVETELRWVKNVWKSTENAPDLDVHRRMKSHIGFTRNVLPVYCGM